jgi:peptidyl-prolyl cis-trans isomerase SurA
VRAGVHPARADLEKGKPVSVFRARGKPYRNVLAAVVVLSLGGAVAGHAQPTGSEPQLVDRIVAIVDEEMILQSDLDREMELYRLEREYNGEEVTASEQEIRAETLERLVESKLIIAAAKQADIHVEPERIQEEVNQKIQQLVDHFGSQAKLERELRGSGMTLEDYRARLNAQLTDQQYLRAVVARFIRPTIEVLENEIRDYYQEHLDEMPATADSLALGDILIPVQPSLAARQAVQRKVQAAMQALDAGTPFAEVARTFSEGPNAKRGGSIGVVQRGDLFDANLEQAAFSLGEGQVSQPVVSQRGVHILRVDAVQSDGARALSQIFFALQIKDVDVVAARTQAEQAYARLQAGEPFSLVAAEVSGDPTSARSGGQLGTFALQDLSPQFQEALRDREAGQLTEPLLTPAGFYIFLVKERTHGRRLTYDEVKENLRRVVEAEKMEAALTKYVAGLRQHFFVDLKS